MYITCDVLLHKISVRQHTAPVTVRCRGLTEDLDRYIMSLRNTTTVFLYYIV